MLEPLTSHSATVLPPYRLRAWSRAEISERCVRSTLNGTSEDLPSAGCARAAETLVVTDVVGATDKGVSHGDLRPLTIYFK